MSKPKKLRDDRIDDITDARVLAPEVVTITEAPGETVTISGECETTEVLLPKARRYCPPACSQCTALRPTGKDYTEVYRTTREDGYIFRYCKCGYCGNTFKDSERI